MSGKVVVKHAFGVSPQGFISYTDDHHIAYVCGHQVVVYNTETKEQGFIPFGTSNQQHQSLGITAICSCVSKKLLAVAEKSDPVGVVTIFDSTTLRKKRTLSFAELGSLEIKSIAFSEDGKFLITQGSSPDWTLVLWNIEKTAKVVCSIRGNNADETLIHQVSICPWDSSIILAIGKASFRLHRVSDGQFKPMTVSFRREQANFLSHCWMPDALIVGTEGGEILLFENHEFRAVVHPAGCTVDATEESRPPVTSLLPTSRGGFISGHGSGEMKLFEKQEELKEQYQLESSVLIPASRRAAIRAISAGSDDNIVLVSEDQKLLHFTVSALIAAKDLEVTHCHVSKSIPGFDNLVTPFHGPNVAANSSITGIDVALWRPIVVTCGMDCTVRVWNYIERKLEHVKEFDDDPLSIAVHPSGLYLAVAFQDKVRFVSVLIDDLHTFQSIACKYCSLLKFARGGHLLAAVSVSVVQIFDTFTGACVGLLKGHNSKLRNLVWLHLDARIMTVGSDGSAYFWDTETYTRRPANFTHHSGFTAGVASSDGSRVYVATMDKLVKQITLDNAVGSAGQELSKRAPMDIEVGRYMSAMVYDNAKGILLVGTSDEDRPCGVLTMQVGDEFSGYIDSSLIHGAPVTALCMSWDGTLIFSGDAHGVLLVSEFEGMSSAKGATLKGRENAASFEFHEEVMMHRSVIEAKKHHLVSLAERVQQLNLNNNYQLRLKEIEHNGKMNEKVLRFTSQLRVETERYEALEKKKNEVEVAFKQQLEDLVKKQEEELKMSEARYQAKVNTESRRHQELISETGTLHKRWNEENAALVESHQAYVNEIAEEFEQKLHGEQSMQRNLQMQTEDLQVNYEKTRDLIEEDAQMEINEIKFKFDGRLQQEDEIGVELLAEHKKMKANLAVLNKDSAQQKEDIRRMRDKEARLVENIKQLDRDIQHHKKDIREREETITDKEKRIFDLKKKNQELEKFRFVLDYKIKELKLQIAPRETEITTLRKQIEEMDLELEHYHKSNEALRLMIDELKLKIDGILKEISLQDKRIDRSQQLIEKFRRDLQELWDVKELNVELKKKVIAVYRFYVQEDVSGGAKQDASSEDRQQLYNRDREQLERSLASLRRMVKANALAHKRDLDKMVHDNVSLTTEINALRKEARYLNLQKKALEEVDKVGGPAGMTGAVAGDMSDLLEFLGMDVKVKDPVQKAVLSEGEAATLMQGQKAAQKPPAYKKTQQRQGRMARSSALKVVAGGDDTRSAEQAVSASLPATAVGGERERERRSRQNRREHFEAWREADMQARTISQLENRIAELCEALGINTTKFMMIVESNIRRNNSKDNFNEF